jgi:hypothetical protein
MLVLIALIFFVVDKKLDEVVRKSRASQMFESVDDQIMTPLYGYSSDHLS